MTQEHKFKEALDQIVGYGKYSDKTKTAILKAMNEFGYRVNPPDDLSDKEDAERTRIAKSNAVGTGLILPEQTDREAVAKQIPRACQDGQPACKFYEYSKCEKYDEIECRYQLEIADRIISLFPQPELKVLSEWIDEPLERGEYWVSAFVDGRYIFPCIISVIDYERPDRGLEVQYDFPHDTIPVKVFLKEYRPKSKWMLIKTPELPN